MFGHLSFGAFWKYMIPTITRLEMATNLTCWLHGRIAVTLGLFFVDRLAYTAHALLQIRCFSLEWPQFMYSIVATITSCACIRWLRAIRPGFDPSSCEPRKTNWGPISLDPYPFCSPMASFVFVMSNFRLGAFLRRSILGGSSVHSDQNKIVPVIHVCKQPVDINSTLNVFLIFRGIYVCRPTPQLECCKTSMAIDCKTWKWIWIRHFVRRAEC